MLRQCSGLQWVDNQTADRCLTQLLQHLGACASGHVGSNCVWAVQWHFKAWRQCC